jgi:uncharacterized protein (TIGR03435 family)
VFHASGQPAVTPEFDAIEVRIAKALPPGTDVEYSTNAAGRLAQVRIGSGTRLPQVTPVFGSNGRVILEAATMRQLIEAAYPEVIRDEYLTGGPRWIDSDRFDLIGKAPPNTPVDGERRMIQAVLARRFHLQVHREDKAMPVYALVAGRKGPKLSPAMTPGDPATCRPHDMSNSPGDGIHYSCHNLTMTGLAEWLPRRASGYIDLPVVDLTGMTAAYDFQLDWSPRMASADSPGGMTIFDALEERLGLKLEHRKHPMPTIVIDHVERIPTEN